MSRARGDEVPIDAQAHPRAAQLVAQMREEFPDFRLRAKQGARSQMLIDRLLRVVTIGQLRGYLDDFHTVLFGTLWLADSWHALDDNERYILLCHERVHLQQRRRYGDVLMALIYLFPILPLGLAYGRARIEWEAYEETLRATYEIYGPEAAERLEPAFVRLFCGAEYGWMWPFPRTIRAWFASALTRVVASARPPAQGPRTPRDTPS